VSNDGTQVTVGPAVSWRKRPACDRPTNIEVFLNDLGIAHIRKSASLVGAGGGSSSRLKGQRWAANDSEYRHYNKLQRYEA
jgi:hypothetical protein